jgi:hypothetical protein
MRNLNNGGLEYKQKLKGQRGASNIRLLPSGGPTLNAPTHNTGICSLQ